MPGYAPTEGTLMNIDIILVSRALDYAAKKHVSQRRKGVAQEPYINQQFCAP